VVPATTVIYVSHRFTTLRYHPKIYRRQDFASVLERNDYSFMANFSNVITIFRSFAARESQLKIWHF